jgi:endonuclease-8
VVRSHMWMKGRWRVLPRDAQIFGVPWLVLRGEEHVGVLSGGSVLELDRGIARRIGPDILAQPPDFDAMVRNLRAEDQRREVGDALLDQRLIGGIGNVWKVESLWAEQVSPWLPLADVPDEALRRVLREAHRLMQSRVDGVPVRRRIYRRKRHACPRCGTPIRSWPQGDQARMAYWCPECQRGEEPRMK